MFKHMLQCIFWTAPVINTIWCQCAMFCDLDIIHKYSCILTFNTACTPVSIFTIECSIVLRLFLIILLFNFVTSAVTSMPCNRMFDTLYLCLFFISHCVCIHDCQQFAAVVESALGSCYQYQGK